MKYINYTLLVLAVIMVVFNASYINFDSPFSKDSFIAVIAVLAALCVVSLCVILLTSRLIEEKYHKLRQ